SLIFFIAGRNEFHDKGIDIYIKALGNLNEILKKEKSKKTIVAFVWVPGNIRGIKQEILENKTLYQDIKDALEDEKDAVVQNMLYSFASGKKISENYLFDEQFLTEMKVKTGKFRKKGKPPILTHDLYDENETIVNAIRAAGLSNDEKDKVKIIYYPIYLSGADGILNLNYYESMQASHLGVFPSYYEPWGYTPLEAGALGVSSVTTDLAGFGRYFCSDCDVSDLKGIYVLKRLNRAYDDVVNQLTGVMHKFSLMTKEERIAGKLKARQIASTADWKSFISHYIEAHNLAVANLHL
ncbi:MAG TPA: hypothetical protein VI564_00410, partial [Candidatus Nanoarchaeia archaeon]|nr:hypothetical protein [Candidatus Nanoarchaeia archaeon]